MYAPELLFLTTAGCVLGVVTGLVPGLHINTVCIIGLTFYSWLGLDAVEFGVVMVAASMTHAFLDFLPGIFLGVPEDGTALNILPSHRLVMIGRGLEAVKLTGYGCLLGLFFGLLFLMPALYVVPAVYRALRGIMCLVLVSAVGVLILRERGFWGKLFSAFVFFLAGFFGLIVLNVEGVSEMYSLLPVFSGMFGLSGIIYSIRERYMCVPQQRYANVPVDRDVWVGGLFGAVGGVVVGVLPAMSPSQIGILMSSVFGSTQKSFIVSVAAINTSDAIYSLVSLYMIGNGRSGVSVMLGRILDLDWNLLVLFVGVFCIAAFVGLYMHIEIGRRAMTFFGFVDYRLLSVSVVLFILTLVYFFTGWFGVLVAVVSTSIGLLPVMSGVSRTHLMGVLLLPTIMYFSGL